MAEGEEIGSSSEMVKSTLAEEMARDGAKERGGGEDMQERALVAFPCGRDSRRTPSDLVALSNR